MTRCAVGWLCAVVLALIGAGPGAGPCGASEAGRRLHVDPARGVDSNSGTEAAPFRTIAAALRRLRAGDTLRLRGGTYYESDLAIAVQGTPDAPTVIEAWPGETVEIDGGYRAFRGPDGAADDWVLVDAVRGLYRSKRKFPGAGRVHGYLESRAGLLHLVTYESYDALATENQHYVDAGPIYVGHGVYWRPDDERIYVRLEPTQLQRQLGYDDPGALDPRSATLHLFPDGDVIRFEPGAAHVVLRGVAVRYRNNALEFATGAHHIEIYDVDLLGGRTHVLIQAGAHHLLFDRNRVHDAVPPWIAWEDVKSGSRPAHQLQGAVFLLKGDAHHIEIRNGSFSGCFDAIDAVHRSHDLHVHHNEFTGIRDDVLQLGSGGHDYHVHHNLMVSVSKGVSRHGSGTSPRPGTTWVHHNVIDASTPMQYGRRVADGSWHGKAAPGDEGRVWAAPFGSHGSADFGEGDAWKIYHNTILLGRVVGNRGAGHTRSRHTRSRRLGARHEVYNNVFVQIDDHWIAREATAEQGLQVYDGNLYFRRPMNPRTPLFRRFLRADGKTHESFRTLADFEGSAFQTETRAFYPPGWGASSVEGDPGLDADYRPRADGPAATGAVQLPEHFPGRGSAHRGALPPVFAPELGIAPGRIGIGSSRTVSKVHVKE